MVTWPTTTTGTPWVLAKPTRAEVTARIWLMLPGRPSWAPLWTVWTESTISAASVLARSWAALKTSSMRVSAISRRPGWLAPRRPQREATWATDSSPLAYSTTPLRRARPTEACRSSVDLPIPGGPPSSTTLPGTRPPPSTRSTSPMPHGRRGWRSTIVCASVEATTLPGPAGRSPGDGAATSSSIEFQASQLGHLPNHPVVTAPHA
nr:hypothetical protein [Nannocystis pusilla]